MLHIIIYYYPYNFLHLHLYSMLLPSSEHHLIPRSKIHTIHKHSKLFSYTIPIIGYILPPPPPLKMASDESNKASPMRV